MIKELKCNSNSIYFDDKYDNSNLSEYYNYILNLIFENTIYIKNKKICFGCYVEECDIKIDFQYEHTIIKEDKKKTFKIHRYDDLMRFDYILDYSNCNVEHLNNFKEIEKYNSKLIYFPPLIYDDLKAIDTALRKKNIVALHNMSTRRAHIYEKMNHDLILDVYDKNEIKKYLDEYKVLINIHQIDEHLTFEELRCLPALLTRILIVSEDVPYRESIPYANHIIWCNYENICDKANEVISNYDFFYEKHMINIEKTYNFLKNENKIKIKNILI
jgi:hypothetical protein